MHPERRTRIVLLGWYGSDNTGDEAVLSAILSSLRGMGLHDLHILSVNPTLTSARHGAPSSSRTIFGKGTLGAVRSAKALILGGGGLIQDRTSIYNLPVYAFYVMLARLFSVRVIGWGLGVEPLGTRLGKALTRFICASAQYFSVRDSGSLRLLRRAGVSPSRITVSADPAFLISPIGNKPISHKHKPEITFCLRDLPNNKPGANLSYVLPVSIRKRLGLGVGENHARTEEFAQSLAGAVQMCVQELGATVTFLPLWPGRDDAIIEAVRSAAVSKGVEPMELSVLPGSSDPEEIARLVASTDLLVSMRLHALIFAGGRGVPLLALAYARKMRGVMRSLGAERWVVEVETRTPSPEELRMKIGQLWQLREREGNQVYRSSKEAARRARGDVEAVGRLLK